MHNDFKRIFGATPTSFQATRAMTVKGMANPWARSNAVDSALSDRRR
jgi:hypothetical protein